MHGMAAQAKRPNKDVTAIIHDRWRRESRLLLNLFYVVMFGALSPSSVCQKNSGVETPVYSTAASVLALSPEEANKQYPAQIRGVVTETDESGMVIHDATAGLWVYWKKTDGYSPGDELEVQGKTSPGLFAPVIYALSVHKLGYASMPEPKPVGFKQLSTGDFDSQYVSIIGVVRSVKIQLGAPSSKRMAIKLDVDGKFVIATVPDDDSQTVDKLTDALVKIRGTAMCTKNDSRQIIAPTLAVSSMRSVTILKPSPTNPFSKPILPISRLMQYRSGVSYYDRVHVTGTVTYFRSESDLILEDQGSALYVRTSQKLNLSIGDHVEAVGFPTPQAGGPILEDAILRRVSVGPPPPARPVQLANVCSGTLNYNLISTTGHLLRRIREPSREALILQDKASLLEAEIDTTSGADLLSHIRDGSTLRVSGISVLEIEGPWNYGGDIAQILHCKILLRSPSDVQVSAPPTWWTTQHVLYLALSLGLLALLFLMQVVRSFIERSRLRAVFNERERLAHEIHDTLAQSFAGIAFQLQAIRKAIPGELPNLQRQVELARELVRHSHKEARRSIEPLHSDSEEVENLLASLDESAQRMISDGSVKVSVSSEGALRPIPPNISIALLRIGQEAIANAVRHAEPTHLQISLQYKGDTVTLSVRDDGAGFVKSGNLLGFGLRGMRRRAAAIGAHLEILSKPGEGTLIVVTTGFQSVLSPAAVLRSLWHHLMEGFSHDSTK